MNEMRKLMEAATMLNESSNIVLIPYDSLEIDEIGSPEQPMQISDWKDVNEGFLEQLADEISKHGLRLYVVDDNPNDDGYMWWIGR